MPAAGVVGIDLSLRRTAAVYLPGDWVPGEWTGIRWVTAGYELSGADPEEVAARLMAIAREVVDFVRGVGAGHVFVEDYAYGMAGKSRAVIGLAELGGAVKVKLLESAVVARPANMASARKLFLGKLPTGKGAAQAAVQAALKQMGSPFVGSDAGDAMVVANAGRSLLGMVACVVG
jgi:hypothetical protein